MKHAMRWALALGLLAGCDLGNDLLDNPEVDLWCGDVPCGWEADGEIERVGTWHSHDYAVSLVGDGARLHQLNADADSYIDCFGISLIAKVEAGTKAFVELDFLDDGVSDWKKQIPTSNFELFEFEVAPPAWFEGVRFIVRKEGPGQVIVARLRATSGSLDGTSSCGGNEVVLKHRPAFAECGADSECAFGACINHLCNGCVSDDDCEDGKVCGYAPVGSVHQPSDVIASCVAAGERAIGALCLGDAECVSGICCEGVCSQCCGQDSCADGQACAPSVVEVERDFVVPHQCAPGEGLAQADAPCTADADCANGTCAALQCTGLCSTFLELTEQEHCAMSSCDEPSCDYFECGVQTLDVGHCD